MFFLELSCFFHDPADVGNLISGSSAFSKTSLNIGKFMAWRILSITLLACEMSAIVWSDQIRSVAQSCPTLCDSMNRSMPGLPVHHQPWSSLKLKSSESVVPSSHLILCHPLFLLPPIPKKGNAKECSNYHTIALISHASKVMLKILQAMNFPMFKLVLEKAEEPEIKMPTSA